MKLRMIVWFLLLISPLVWISKVFFSVSAKGQLKRAEMAKLSDDIIVYRLQGEESQETDEVFLIGKHNVYGSYGKIFLSEEQKRQFIEGWRCLSFNGSTGYFCHFATYGILISRNGREIFRCTICWSCENIALHTYSDEVSLAGFSSNGDSLVLHDFLDRELPYKRNFWKIRQEEVNEMLTDREFE